MRKRSLVNGTILIAVVVLGVILVNLLIKGACYLLLAMLKYPVETMLVTLALTALLVIGDVIYTKIKNK